MNSFDIVESSFSSLENSFKGWLIPSQIAQGFRLGPLLFVKLWFQDYWSAAKCWNKLLRIFEENDAEDVVFDNHSDRDDWRGDKVCRLVPRQRRDNAPPAPRRHLIIDPVPQPNTSRLVKANLRFFVQLNRWVQGNAPQQWMAWKAGTPTQKEISSPKFYLFTPPASVFSSFFLIFNSVFSTISLYQNWLTTVLQHNEIFFSFVFLHALHQIFSASCTYLWTMIELLVWAEKPPYCWHHTSS